MAILSLQRPHDIGASCGSKKTWMGGPAEPKGPAGIRGSRDNPDAGWEHWPVIKRERAVKREWGKVMGHFDYNRLPLCFDAGFALDDMVRVIEDWQARRSPRRADRVIG
jgi:hypothetical protein